MARRSNVIISESGERTQPRVIFYNDDETQIVVDVHSVKNRSKKTELLKNKELIMKQMMTVIDVDVPS